jgi:hypothetical protein
MLPAPEGRQTKARLPSRGAPLSISLCRPAGAGESRGYPSTPRLTPWAILCRPSGPVKWTPRLALRAVGALG